MLAVTHRYQPAQLFDTIFHQTVRARLYATTKLTKTTKQMRCAV
jgi:hypothetical protein